MAAKKIDWNAARKSAIVTIRNLARVMKVYVEEEDIAQEAMIRVLRHYDPGVPGSVGGFASKCAKNAFFDARRRSARHNRDKSAAAADRLSPPEPLSPEEEIERRDARAKQAKALAMIAHEPVIGAYMTGSLGEWSRSKGLHPSHASREMRRVVAEAHAVLVLGLVPKPMQLVLF